MLKNSMISKQNSLHFFPFGMNGSFTIYYSFCEEYKKIEAYLTIILHIDVSNLQKMDKKIDYNLIIRH